MVSSGVTIKKGERIDDLQTNGLRIIQNPDYFRFGCDAVELADFVTGGVKDYACDLGSGSGIIAVLLAGKKHMRVTAVEIQQCMAEMASRSVKLNNLSDRIEVVNVAMQNFATAERAGTYSIVVCNPPYRKIGSGEKQSSGSIAISRHEIAVTFPEVAAVAAKLLKQGGAFYTVNQCERLAEVMSECRKFRLEPKILQILTPSGNKKPHIFLLKCVFDGKSGLSVLPEREVRTEV